MFINLIALPVGSLAGFIKVVLMLRVRKADDLQPYSFYVNTSLLIHMESIYPGERC